MKKKNFPHSFFPEISFLSNFIEIVEKFDNGFFSSDFLNLLSNNYFKCFWNWKKVGVQFFQVFSQNIIFILKCIEIEEKQRKHTL